MMMMPDDGGCNGDDVDGGRDDERVGHLGRCKSKHSCATTVTVQLKSNAEVMSQFKQNAADDDDFLDDQDNNDEVNNDDEEDDDSVLPELLRWKNQ